MSPPRTPGTVGAQAAPKRTTSTSTSDHDARPAARARRIDRDAGPREAPTTNVDDALGNDAGVPAIDGVRVGIGGWTYAPWRDTFYPAGLVHRRELEFVSRRLSTIEINGTFYRAQKPAVYAKWAAQAPAGFVFCLKAPQYVTQRGPLAKSSGAAAAFINGGLAEFGERLGPIVWQMPPSREFDPDDLAAFLDALPRALDGRALRHALEVRHDSFLDPRHVALTRQYGVATVYTDTAEYPSIADLGGDFVYARLRGSRGDIDTGYDAAELDQWARRAREWAAGGDPADLPHVTQPAADGAPRTVFIHFIAAAKQRNPAAAMALIARLRELAEKR